MGDDTEFTPKLGKIRSLGSKRGQRYLNRVIRAVALAGGRPKRGKRGFSGNHRGRGAGAGRVLGGRDRYGFYRQRRVTIKSRFVRVKGKTPRGPKDHLRYIQRDGVTREGSPGELYDKGSDRADGEAFLERGKDDRHQFRFIVSAEDADHYDDLKPLIRRLMTRMEEDLGTDLDWVAVDHFNTGHPHTHIVLSGHDDQGKDLVIAREYISRGMRERACEIVSFDLGPRTDLEIEHRLRLEIEQERFTSIDRGLLREAEDDMPVRSNREGLPAFQQTIRAGRLQKLKRLGLAEEVAPGLWTLDKGMESTLRDMGVRDDIIKTMHRELKDRARDVAPSDYAIFEPGQGDDRPLAGRVAAIGYSDELNERKYLIVDGLDGYTHYVDVGRIEDLPHEGQIISLTGKSFEPRDVDRTIAEIAAAHDGRYDVDIHLRHDPRATADFAETHVRRLEAIRRATNGVERTPDGTWLIAEDHLDRVRTYEQKQASRFPVNIETLSRLSLDQQIGTDGSTWLDRQLLEGGIESARAQGFGAELKAAAERRRLWLIEQGLAEEEQRRTLYRSNLLAILRRRELTRVGAQLSKEMGLAFLEMDPKGRIEGVYRKSVDLASGRFAVIEREGRSFNLVPWRRVLDRSLGKEVSGMARGDTISWTIGRGRERAGPSR